MVVIISPNRTPAKAPAKGHLAAWRAQPEFKPEASLKVEGGNPWAAKAAAKFYEQVLAKKPTTVGKALSLGQAAGFTPGQTQGHLRWFFTWVRDDACLLVNGKRYAETTKAKAA
jgi:hypothetical protein